MRANGIEHLISVGRPSMATDASFAVFASSRPDIAANRAVGQLWRVELPTGETRRLTRGVADSSPRLSGDDATIAFLRSDPRGKAQVFILAADGGEPVQATDAPLGVSDFAWSSDARSLAFTARIPEDGRYGSVEGLDAVAEAPRRITGIRWQSNGLGYIADRPAQVFVVDAPHSGSEPFYEPAAAVRGDHEDAPKMRLVEHDAVQLTAGSNSHSGVVFVGDEILTLVDHIESDRRDLRSRLVAIPRDGGAVREIVGIEAGLSISEVAVAADGAIALLAMATGESGVDFVGGNPALWLLIDGAEPRRLTDPESIDLGEVGSHITPLGEDLLVQDRTRGRVRLLRVMRSGSVSEVLAGDVEINAHAAAISHEREQIIAAVASPTSYGELVAVHNAVARPLTSFGPDPASIIVPQELTVTARDGYPVHGWVATPAGDGPFPVILQIHGGPYAAYGIHLFDETQVLVEAGYAVVYCNPRGSAGYGQAHGRSIRQAMGTVDYTDVIDFLDAAIAASRRLEANRVGIMGGSYGGYLTAWTIAHDQRFAGAIVERGFLDPISFQGTSDIGSFFGDEYVGTDAESIARQSPLAVVAGVRTPTLVMHSELDFRCPLEQATRYYAALRRQGTEAEMLIFPGENHELTRAGQPRHRVERFDAILDWWQRMLPVR